MSARRALRGVRAPDELGARQRAWDVVHSAYLDRAPAPTRRSRRPLAVLALAAALAAALALALSPAGATVGRWIRNTLGVPHPAPALFSLPARGSVLLSGAGGTWSVAADGSTRHLGAWRQASWSPHGLFVAVARDDQLAAVDPRGMVRWTLARPAVSDARWYAPSGFRVAYRSRHDLRVVAGDGTGDHVLAGNVAPVAPAWRPGRPDGPYELSYVSADGRVIARDADSLKISWTVVPPSRPREIAWSADGTRLLVVTRDRALVYGRSGRPLATIATPSATPILDAALSADGRRLALVRGGAGEDVVLANLQATVPRLRRILSGEGLRQVAWSPDGRWLLVSWPAADQWVFARTSGMPRIAAVSRIARQFSGGAARVFPRIEGWCCTSQGAAG